MIKNRLIVLVFLFITTFTFAQQNSVEVTKKDGRYITHLDINVKDGVSNKDKSGLVKSIKLGIEWWSLMGEPIEKYLIKWERGSSIKSSKHLSWVSENELQKYPDLLKRYKKLKPTKIDLEFTVVFNFDNQEDFVKNIPKCMRSTHSLGVAYNFINGERKLSSKTNYLIQGAGVNGNDLVPGSPKTWSDFISYNCNSDNSIIKSIFTNSKNAKFMLLEIIKIEVPTIEIDAIVGEYLKREMKKDEKETKTKVDDFWSDNDSKPNDITNKTNDDFWNEKSNTKQDNDFWEGDRLTVNVKAPANGSSFDNNVIDFSASYNLFTDGFAGYLQYNGVNQRVVPVNGNFKGKIVLKSGINRITFIIKNGSTTIYEESFTVTYTGKPVKLRVTLTWDSYADIDLYLNDANNETCSYSNKNTQLAKLDVDNTQAYGPENISVETITSGEYQVYIKNFSGTANVTVTVYIYVNEELESTNKHTFSGGKSIHTIKYLNL